MARGDAPEKTDKGGSAASSSRRFDRRQQQELSSSSAGQALEQPSDSVGALAAQMATVHVQRSPRAPAAGSASQQPNRSPAAGRGGHRHTARPANASMGFSRGIPDASAPSYPPKSATTRRDGPLPASVTGTAGQQTTDPGSRGEDPTLRGKQKELQTQSTGASSRVPQMNSPKTQISRQRGAGESSTSRGGMQDYSVTASDDQFRPQRSGNQQLVPSLGKPASRSARRLPGKMGIGIETEFLLAARQSGPKIPQNLYDFANDLVNAHNSLVDPRHPRMANDVRITGSKPLLDHWSLVRDGTMETTDSPWGIEMTTPLFVAFPGSQWRKHVEATWRYLQESYEITDNLNCGTHIHLSVEGGYFLEDLKRLAQSVIHFEPAFEALAPPHRRADIVWSKSSWLDSPDLAGSSLSRAESIELIASVTEFEVLLNLMNNLDTLGSFSWNFRKMEKYYTVEFRKPPASKSAEEALAWAEFAMNFVQASLNDGLPKRLQQIPPTVGGLHWFLQQNLISGSNEPARLGRLFKGKDPKSFLHVRPKGYKLDDEQKANVRKVIEADKTRVEKLIRTTSAPYWFK